MRALYKCLSSLRLTVVLLAFSMLLVFLATFEQMQLGVFEVQKRFFETLFAVWHWPPQWWGAASMQWLHLPLPGGFLLGGLLIINLLCAHFRYFRASWRKTGIIIIHTGIVLLIASGFSTAYFQHENYMWIDVGGSSNYLESFHDVDLALIDHTDPKEDVVVSIPSALLARGQAIHDPALPFTVRPVFYYNNSDLEMRAQHPQAPEIPADHGVAQDRGIAIEQTPYDYTEDSNNFASAVVAIDTPAGPVGSWLVSEYFMPRNAPPFLKGKLPQTFTVNGHTWEVALRPRREYLPYTLQLDKFIHETYPGTTVPKRFESQAHLLDSTTGENRAILIYMNHPLRYGGLTFYQASFGSGDAASMLEVVRNPGWLLPYLSVGMVGFGMALHFILSLLAYQKRQNQQARAAASSTPAPRSP
jgi:hypothetical protein